MEWNKKTVAAPKSIIVAADIIVSLLTPDQIELLDITLNGKKIPIFDQLVARGYDHVPIDENPFIFTAHVAQILDTNQRGLVLLARLKQKDFLLELLDPENYKEKRKKSTGGKTLDKRNVDSINDNVSLIKSLGRNISGEGGTNRDTDYGSMGDTTDRKRLDAVQIKRSDRNLLATETGQEDDTRGTDEEEDMNFSDVDAFLKKKERLDLVEARRKGNERPLITLSDNYEEIKEKKIDIFDLSLTHSTNASVSDSAIKQNTFVESTKRQGFITLREQLILADAINNIHNVEFIDVREKFFKLFDPLFRRSQKICQ